MLHFDCEIKASINSFYESLFNCFRSAVHNFSEGTLVCCLFFIIQLYCILYCIVFSASEVTTVWRYRNSIIIIIIIIIKLMRIWVRQLTPPPQFSPTVLPVDRLNRPSSASLRSRRTDSALGPTRLLRQIREPSKCRHIARANGLINGRRVRSLCALIRQQQSLPGFVQPYRTDNNRPVGPFVCCSEGGPLSHWSFDCLISLRVVDQRALSNYALNKHSPVKV